MIIFETFDQKLKVLLSIICDTKINLEWITPPPISRSPPSPPLCLTHPLILQFFNPPPPLFSISSICNSRGEGGLNSVYIKGRKTKLFYFLLNCVLKGNKKELKKKTNGIRNIWKKMYALNFSDSF